MNMHQLINTTELEKRCLKWSASHGWQFRILSEFNRPDRIALILDGSKTFDHFVCPNSTSLSKRGLLDIDEYVDWGMTDILQQQKDYITAGR